ncbi:hypothetical protein OAU31_03830 [Alphaproteobacteria bacterium]|jgi:hypothetical protein|nr:hypothetical protein [Alphaproteobacteria bacterium]
MRVGIDIDNTIICYDDAFPVLAQKTGFDVPFSANKQEVRAWFHERGLHNEFTLLQGKVYGRNISMAHVFEGVQSFLAEAIGRNYEVFLVSHKTKYPIKGEKLNLHEATLAFLSDQHIVGEQQSNSIPFDNVYFEPTLEFKVKKIVDLKLDYFIDDLLTILNHEKFPDRSCRIWFSGQTGGHNNAQIEHCESWFSINKKIFGLA